MELIVRIIPEEDKRKSFAAECNKCGWIGSSREVGVSKSPPETGCSGDIYCPCCGTTDIDEVDNEQPIASFIDRLKKATDLIKVLKDALEDRDLSKHINSYIEESVKDMAAKLDELKNKQ